MKSFDIRRILVPTDFSACAAAAYGPARALAALTGAEVVALHVIEHPVRVVDSDVYLDIVHGIPDRREDCLAALERTAREAFPSLRVRCTVAEGEPEAKIAEAAGREQADLIVMGTHGRTGLSHFLLGSAAEHLTRKAPCPVLTVKATAAETAPEPGAPAAVADTFWAE
jgi:nucleotide-binding universal stress UspA family protein